MHWMLITPLLLSGIPPAAIARKYCQNWILFTGKWKAAGLKIFAVAKETDGTKKDWLNFINEQHLQEWTHVYYSKADDKARTNAGIPGYSQLYDVQTFPTLYLLDKDKRIVAKKLTYQQIDEVLELKMKGQ